MNIQSTIQRTVRYQGKLLGNVAIQVTGDNTGLASIGGRSRKVTYRIATTGKAKGTMQWHCDD